MLAPKLACSHPSDRGCSHCHCLALSLSLCTLPHSLPPACAAPTGVNQKLHSQMQPLVDVAGVFIERMALNDLSYASEVAACSVPAGRRRCCAALPRATPHAATCLRRPGALRGCPCLSFCLAGDGLGRLPLLILLGARAALQKKGGDAEEKKPQATDKE